MRGGAGVRWRWGFGGRSTVMAVGAGFRWQIHQDATEKKQSVQNKPSKIKYTVQIKSKYTFTSLTQSNNKCVMCQNECNLLVNASGDGCTSFVLVLLRLNPQSNETLL